MRENILIHVTYQPQTQRVCEELGARQLIEVQLRAKT